APVRIGGREYVDGGVWSPTNLDVVQAGRGTEVLCLSVLGSLPLVTPPQLAALRARARAIEAVEAGVLRRRGARLPVVVPGGRRAGARAVGGVEAGVVRRRGARLRVVVPDARSAAAIGGRLMDRSRAEAALAAGWAQGVALAG